MIIARNCVVVVAVVLLGLVLSAHETRADGWGSYNCGSQPIFSHASDSTKKQQLEGCAAFYGTSNPSIRLWNVQATVWRIGTWTPEWLQARRLGWDRCSAAEPWALQIDGSSQNYGQTSVQGNTQGNYQNCVTVHFYHSEDWGTMKPSGLSSQLSWVSGPT